MDNIKEENNINKDNNVNKDNDIKNLEYIFIGGSSYIASTLAKYILKQNKEIKILSVDFKGVEKTLKQQKDEQVIYLSNNELFKLNSEDFKNIGLNIENATVVNFAFGRSNDLESVMSSVKFTHDITKKTNDFCIDKYIYISSQSVYDNKRIEPAKETDVYKAFNLYGLAKIYLEEWLNKYFKNKDVSLYILRLGSIVGPAFEKRITRRFVKMALNAEVLNVHDANQQFSYTFISDIIHSIYMFLECIVDKENNNIINNKINEQTERKTNNRVKKTIYNQSSEIYNIGTDEIYSLVDIASMVKEVLEEKEENIDVNINVEKKGEEYYTSNAINIEKFKKLTKYNNKYNLRKIILAEYEEEK